MPEQKQNLLIVDNDARSLRVLEVSLRKAGYMVTTATSMRDALAIVKDNPPELIVSEVSFGNGDDGPTAAVANNQPVEDGYALLRAVRELPQLSHTAFVFVTARTDVESKIRGLELGADEFLAKPIFAKEIVARLRLILQRRSRSKIEDAAAGSDRTLFAGQLADMAVVDLLQTVEISRKSGVLQLHCVDGRVGAIYFQDGNVIDAETGRLVGDRAIHRMLTWSDGSFEVAFRDISRDVRVTAGTQAVLMEGLRRLDEWNRICEQLPPLHHSLDLDIDQLKRRLGDVPDEYNELIRLLDGRLAILDAVDASGVPDLTALEQLAKLYFEGLLQDMGPASSASPRPRPESRQPTVQGAGGGDANRAPAATGAAAQNPSSKNGEEPSVSFEEAFDGVPSRVTEPEQLEQLRELTAPGSPIPVAQALQAVYAPGASLPTKVPAIISPRRLKPNTAPLGEMPLRSARNPLDSLSPPISPATPRTISSKAAEIARASAKALEEFETDLATRQIKPLSQGQVLLAQLASTPAPLQEEPRQRLTITPRSRRTGTLPGNNDPIPAAIVAAEAVPMPIGGMAVASIQTTEEVSAPRSSRRRSALIDAAIVQAAVEPSGAIARSAGLAPEAEHVNEFSTSEVTEEMTDPGVGRHLQPRTMAGELPPIPSAAMVAKRSRGEIDDPLVGGATGTLSTHNAVPVESVVIDESYAALPFPASPVNPAQRVSKMKIAQAPAVGGTTTGERAAVPPPIPLPRTVTRDGSSGGQEVKPHAASDRPAGVQAVVAGGTPDKAPPMPTEMEGGIVLSQANESEVTELDFSGLSGEANAAVVREPESPRRETSVVTELSVSRVAPRAPNTAPPMPRARARESTGTSAYARPKRRIWPWVAAGLFGAAVAVAISLSGSPSPTQSQARLTPAAGHGDAGVATDAGVAVAVAPDASATPDAGAVVLPPPDAVAAVVPPPVDAPTPTPTPVNDHEIHADDSSDGKSTEPFRKYLSEARDRLSQSDLPRARLAIEKSLSEKRTARGLLVKADILRRLGETQKAIATIDEALDMSSEYVAAWDAKGRVLWSIGRKAEARAAWNEYLKRRPEGDTADRIREILSQ